MEGQKYIDKNIRRKNMTDTIPMIGVSYLIVNRDGKIKAINGETMQTDYSGYNANIVIQKSINSVEEGDTIQINPGIYTIRKLSMKPVNLIGSGKSTILKLADNVNSDMIESYSGGNLNNRVYYKRGKIANLKIDGNKDHQNSGNGIVLAWTMEYILDNIQFENIKGYAIKLLRSFWTSTRNISISGSTNGIKIGEYDITGKYNNGSPIDLFTNQNNFTTVNIHGDGVPNARGIHIESGDANTFIGCDTSGCATGIHLEAVTGVDHVWRTNLIAHWFEANITGIKMVNGGTEGTRYTYLHQPVFSSNNKNIDDNTGHYILITADSIEGGLYAPDITLYRLFTKYGIYKGAGDEIYIKDPVSMTDIFDMRTYSADYGGNFANFNLPSPKGKGHFFFAHDISSTNPSKRLYVSLDGIRWNFTTFS